jgi:tRNA-dihydrouridine synthase B
MAKKLVTIPVIGNGDMYCEQDVKKFIEYTGVNGTMIARGSIHNPTIF